MRVLVTGGTGYLGAAIVRTLASRGHTPVILARRASASALPGVPIDADIRDLPALRAAADGADAIIHTAALVSLWRPRPHEFREINVAGLHNVLDTTRTLGIRRLIYTSSFLALPPHGASTPLDANDYQRTKREARDVARAALAAGAPLAILYPGVVYGPGPVTEGNLVGRLLRDHLAGRLPGVIGADRHWSFAYVDDVASAHVTAMETDHARGEYVLGGENAPQMRLFEVAGALAGVKIPRRIPTTLAYLAAAVEEARAALSRHTPQITRGAVAIFLHDWRLDSGRSVRELNYRITPLSDGIRTTLKELQ